MMDIYSAIEKGVVVIIALLCVLGIVGYLISRK
jgi:hypothetical protein